MPIFRVVPHRLEQTLVYDDVGIIIERRQNPEERTYVKPDQQRSTGYVEEYKSLKCTGGSSDQLLMPGRRRLQHGREELFPQ
jgi:hypothetical protein